VSKQVEAVNLLRTMTTADLDEHLRQQRRRLFEVRFQQAAGQVENHRQVRELRREIARTMTIQLELAHGHHLVSDLEVEEEPEEQPRPRRLLRRRQTAVPAGEVVDAEPVDTGAAAANAEPSDAGVTEPEPATKARRPRRSRSPRPSPPWSRLATRWRRAWRQPATAPRWQTRAPRGPTRSRQMSEQPVTEPTVERTRRKVRDGVVVSDKMQNTVVVLVEEKKPHRLYKKVVTRNHRLKVHDAEGTCAVGDRVRITETRPISKEKRWRVSEIIEKAK